MRLTNQYSILRVAASDKFNLDEPGDEFENDDDYDQELEDVNNMVRNVGSVASNSYRRTRPLRPFGESPTEIMSKTLKKAIGYRNWVKRIDFPVSTTNVDAAISALTDSILDWRKTGGEFEHARYEKGADPASAENLEQFALFFHKRLHQPLVYGKQWAGFAHYWDLFIKELYQAFDVWKQQREERKSWGEPGEYS